MLRLLTVPRPDELVQVRIAEPGWKGEGGGTFTNALWEQLRDRQDVFSDSSAWGDVRFELAQGGAVHFADGIWVSGNFFKTLLVPSAAGRLIAAADDRQ
jgi:hypothetical protein